MAIAQSNRRGVIYAAQSAFGTPAATSGATPLFVRRASLAATHARNVITSAEKRYSMQVGYEAHGLNQTSLAVDCELYPNSWTAFFEGLFRRAFTAVTAVTASSGDGFTIASGVLTRAAGGAQSFLTDGIKRGSVIKITLSNIAGNNDRNFLVTAVTATTLTLVAVSGAAIADMSTPDTDAVITVTGKRTYIPTTGWITRFFTVEDRYADLDQSITYQDQLFGSATITLAPNQIATLQFGSVGSGVVIEGDGSTSPYFTDAGTPACGEDGFSTARGYLSIGGNKITVATNVTINIDWGLTAPEVAFSQTSPDVFYNEVVNVTGSGAAFKNGNSLRNLFVNETEVPIFLVLETVDGQTFSIAMPRCKINTNGIDDSANGLTESFDFRALEQCDVAQDDHTCISIQDSSLT